MAEIYSHRWTSCYGTDPATGAGETWAKGLAGMTDAEFQTGIENCILSADPWPPTLPAFRAMCLDLPEIDEVVAELMTMQPPASDFAERVLASMPDDLFQRHSADKCERFLTTAARMIRKEVMRETLPESARLSHEQKRLG